MSCLSARYEKAARIKEIFRTYDENGDGSISCAELQAIFKALGALRDIDVNQIFAHIDKKRDGKIQFEDFVDWMVAADDQDARAPPALGCSTEKAAPKPSLGAQPKAQPQAQPNAMVDPKAQPKAWPQVRPKPQPKAAPARPPEEPLVNEEVEAWMQKRQFRGGFNVRGDDNDADADWEYQRVIFKGRDNDGKYRVRSYCELSLEPALVWRYPPGKRPSQLSGVTLAQLREICRAHLAWLETPKWNDFTKKMQRPTMYDVVSRIVKPATKDTQGSYAELFPQQEVQVFVSHWWGEEFLNFVAALEHAAKELGSGHRGTPESVVFWVCSFANPQWTVSLGNSLAESPFELALAHRSCRAVVMVLDPDATPLTRIWCIYEVLRAHVLQHPFCISTKDGLLLGEGVGRDAALADTMTALAERILTVRPEDAQASCEDDKTMIVAEVQKTVGVPQFAFAVQGCLFDVMRQAGYAMFSRNWRLNFKLLTVHRLAAREVYWLQKNRDRGKSYRGQGGWREKGDLDETLERLAGRRCELHAAAQVGDVVRLRALLEAERPLRAAAEEARHEQPGGVNLFECRYAVRKKVTEACSKLQDRPDELGQRALHLAARYCGDPAVVEVLLEYRADIHARDVLGRTPLHRAAEAGDVAMLAALVGKQKGEDWAEEMDNRSHSALDLAVLSGTSGAVKTLVNLRAAVAGSSAAAAGSKRTALHLAAQWNLAAMLPQLVGLGCPVDAADGDGTTALHLAARFGHELAVRALASLRADVAQPTGFGRTALHWAALNGLSPMVACLLELSCPIDEADGCSWTALHWALRRRHAGTVSELLRRQASVAPTDRKRGRGALHLAAASGIGAETLELLVGSQCDPAAKDVSVRAALHVAAEHGMEESVVKLVEFRSDVGWRCSHNRTALHLAAKCGHDKVAVRLVELRSDVALQDFSKRDALFLAARHDQFETVLALVALRGDPHARAKDGTTLLHMAARSGKEFPIQELVRMECDVGALTVHGRSPLHWAALNGHVKALKALLELRGDAEQPQRDGWRPIHLAARHGHREAVWELVQARCDASARGVHGKTPLHCWARWNNYDLGFRGSSFDPSHRDDSGRHALHIAAIYGQAGWFDKPPAHLGGPADKLLDALQLEDAHGRTPLHLAALHGHQSVLEKILGFRAPKPPQQSLHWGGGGEKKKVVEDDGQHAQHVSRVCLACDRQHRLPLHLACQARHAKVVGQLASAMLKAGLGRDAVLQVDALGETPVSIAVRRRDVDSAQRLADRLSLDAAALGGLAEELAAESLVGLEVGSNVQVRRDVSGLKEGMQGVVHDLPREGRGPVTLALQGQGEPVALSLPDFARCVAAEKPYLLNAGHWYLRAKCRYPKMAYHDCKVEGGPRLVLMGGLATYQVVRGVDEGDGWLRAGTQFLPMCFADSKAPNCPAMTPWTGPAIAPGVVVRAVEELSLVVRRRGRRRTLAAGVVGVVQHIFADNSAEVLFDVSSSSIQEAGKKEGKKESKKVGKRVGRTEGEGGAAFLVHGDQFKAGLEVLRFNALIKNRFMRAPEPGLQDRDEKLPPDGTIVAHKDGVGAVVRTGSDDGRVWFRVLWPSSGGSKELRSGIPMRLLSQPSVGQVAEYLRRWRAPS